MPEYLSHQIAEVLVDAMRVSLEDQSTITVEPRNNDDVERFLAKFQEAKLRPENSTLHFGGPNCACNYRP